MSDSVVTRSPFKRRPLPRRRLLWNRPRLVSSVVIRPEQERTEPFHWEAAYGDKDDSSRILMFAMNDSDRTVVQNDTPPAGLVLPLFPES